MDVSMVEVYANKMAAFKQNKHLMCLFMDEIP